MSKRLPRMQPRSAGLSVLDAAAERGRFHQSAAALASSEHGPRTTRLANFAVHRVGGSASKYMRKMNPGMAELSKLGAPGHVHEMYEKYNKPMKNGILAHKMIYGGGGPF